MKKQMKAWAIAGMVMGSFLASDGRASTTHPTSLATEMRVIDGVLIGTYVVRCPVGHDDTVHDLTRNHDCEKCGRKSVDGGSAKVVCPNGHASSVSEVTAGHKCPVCERECRR